jgi:hypothetical protein
VIFSSVFDTISWNHDTIAHTLDLYNYMHTAAVLLYIVVCYDCIVWFTNRENKNFEEAVQLYVSIEVEFSVTQQYT